MSNTPRTRLAPDKPTIKILLYTDDPQIAETHEFGQFLGLGSMKERLEAHKPAFADLDVRWISRNPDADHHAANKLNDILSREHYDEIWFFGMHQCNTNKFSLLERRGGAESELNEEEIAALTEWMRIGDDGCGGGGILMTGDHSNENPLYGLAATNGNHNDPAAGPEFLGIGRALGCHVPRAGALRKWEGSPTHRSDDSFSTISNGGFQMDRIPQQLELRPVDVKGDPDPDGQPHPLFFYREGRYIQFFPDHAHEGAVVTPDVEALLDREVWPCDASGRQILPHVVARGTDARRPNDPINIIATYNGDLAGVGRIVADSTFHHYMNLNLRGFPHPALTDSPSDQIGQFYANLAVWLAPKYKRQAMARLMFSELARYTPLQEAQEAAESTGAAARSLLAMASSCELHELTEVDTPVEMADLYGAREIQMPSRHGLSGSVLKSSHDAVRVAGSAMDPDFQLRSIIKAGLKERFQEQEGQVRNTLQTLSGLPIIGNGASVCDEANESWTIQTLSDPRPGRPQADNMYFFCLSIDEGIISGRVSDSDIGEYLSPVTGTLMPLEDSEGSFSMTLDFFRDAQRVTICGVRSLRSFRGTFTCAATAAEAASAGASYAYTYMDVAMTPGDGDTGSASGTQT
jgi:hypothetical protein